MNHAIDRLLGYSRRSLAPALLVLAAALPLVVAAADTAAARPGQPLATVPVASVAGGAANGFDGVVQAVRQTAVAAQVAGTVVALPVRAGDRVKAGQVLLRLDARAAEQTAAAGAAQVVAARTAQDEARNELQRQHQLFEKGYISQAALDRAEAAFRSTQAQAKAQVAVAGAAQTQSGFYVVKAPYDAIVSDVAVVLGDMAMPGRPLLTLYDPAVLRVSVAVPQTTASRLAAGQSLSVELPTGSVTAVRTQLLPAVDPATHTLELRLELPAPLAGVAPGMFARVWLPSSGGEARLFVPVRSVVRRAELSAVYVLDGAGRPLLRQVRLGRVDGERVEVLAGLGVGERVVLEPQAAARQPAKELP